MQNWFPKGNSFLFTLIDKSEKISQDYFIQQIVLAASPLASRGSVGWGRKLA